MSYSRRYHTQIAVHYSGTVSYPASQSGGTTSYSGTAYEDVTIDVDVDTRSFDAEVSHCRGSVGDLTGSVIATEAAQIASIRHNAQKVGSTIIKGFFDTVRSEVSQQIMELTAKIDSTLIHLNQLATRCKEKQTQMQNDYGRISSRYLKIFEDLNNELENRIYELCRPVFLFKRDTDEKTLGTICSDMTTIATVSGAEHGALEARLASSLAKRRAVDTILQANGFLTKQKRTEYVLTHSTIDDATDGSLYLPVCYLETRDNGVTDRKSFKPGLLDGVNNQRLVESLSESDMNNLLESDSTQLEESFNREVSSTFKDQDAHNKRVMDYVTKLFYSNIKQ